MNLIEKRRMTFMFTGAGKSGYLLIPKTYIREMNIKQKSELEVSLIEDKGKKYIHIELTQEALKK